MRTAYSLLFNNCFEILKIYVFTRKKTNMLPNFGYTVDRDFMEILPQVLDFLHITDILDLLQTNQSVHALVDSRVTLSGRWKTLEINSSEGDLEQDKLWSEFVTLDEPEIVGTVLCGTTTSSTRRYADCERIVLNNIESVEKFVEKKFAVKIFSNICDLKMNKFRFNFSFVANKLTTLRLGIDLIANEWIGDQRSIPELRLPELRCLDISGFPILDSRPDSKFNRWLISLLSSTKVRRLRLNCVGVDDSHTDNNNHPIPPSWDSSELSFLEINFTKNFKKSKFSGKQASDFSDMMISTTNHAQGFPKLHTVVVGPPTTPLMIRTLSKCPNMMHAVFNSFQIDDLSDFNPFLEKTIQNLQILILKIPGQSRFHFDSFLHMMILASNGNSSLPPLMRFELEVVMDDETGLIKPPYHTVKGAAAVRCRYPDNMYFRRSKYGIAMSSYRPLCTEAPGPASIASPMELFAEEIIRGVHCDSTISDAEMYTEWNNLGQRMRSMYVEIFDEYVERELRHGATSYTDLMRMLNDSSSRETASTSNIDKSSLVCDVAATMANLRE